MTYSYKLSIVLMFEFFRIFFWKFDLFYDTLYENGRCDATTWIVEKDKKMERKCVGVIRLNSFSHCAVVFIIICSYPGV